MLATLSRYPPDPRQPFLPSWPMNGQPAKGICYGTDIHEYPYSDNLLDLIQECLYEHPKHRPTFPEFKERIRKGFEIALLADSDPEPWADFLPPAPLPLPGAAPNAANANANGNANSNAGGNQNTIIQPAIAQHALPAIGAVFRCAHLYLRGGQCKRRFIYDGSHVYCRGRTGHQRLHS
jgi:hypothetical protein